MGEKDQDILSLEDLEKSWSDSKTLLKSILGDENTGDEKKKKKEESLSKSKDEDDDSNELFDDEEEEEEEDDEDMKKSLEDEFSKDDDTAAAMDVEPFLRKMVKSMSKRLAALEKSQSATAMMLAKSLLAIGEQNMTIAGTVHAFAEAPVGSTSVIRKSLDRFPEKKAEGEDLLKSMNKDSVLEKALALSKKGTLTSRDVAKIQTRLNKGIPLQAEYVTLLTEKGDK